MTRFIGISGRKGSGKDAAALGLTSVGWRRIAFADALKAVVMDLYGLSWNQCYGTIAEKEAIDLRWGLSAREILQRFGSEGARKAVHARTWISALFRDVEDFEERGLVRHYDPELNHWTWIRAEPPPEHPIRRMWVLPDVRYDNEVDAIRERGGLVVRVVRPNSSTGAFEQHDSETGVDQLDVDHEIVNDGTLAQLQDRTRTLVITRTSCTPRE